jgi:sigma-54 dependent transcriptional regulator, acetoin dehydrogenase operon transcriptional activator AcoR
MTGALWVEAARRSFLAGGEGLALLDQVRDDIVASWRRSQHIDADPEQVKARFAGHLDDPVAGCAEQVFEEFFGQNPESSLSLVLADAAGVIRVRRDGPGLLGHLLDAVLLVPGYDYSELAMGTTAISVALHARRDAVVAGPEHYHSRLLFLSEAAAVVVPDGTVPAPGGAAPAPVGAVAVLCHLDDGTGLQLPLARMLAQRVAARLPGDQEVRAQVIAAEFGRRDHRGDPWVVATDGSWVMVNSRARQLDAADLVVLSDLAFSALMVGEFTTEHVELPSGSCAEVSAEGIRQGGTLIGSLLTAGRAREQATPEVPEWTRRQGSHVAPVTRRDYAQDHRSASDQRLHAEARIRANRELLTPFLRARQEVAACVKQGRNHLLIGEPGVGKRTLVVSQFRQAFPLGRVVTLDCAQLAAGLAATRTGPLADLAEWGGEPRLLLLNGMNRLSPLEARRLDEWLRLLVALPAAPLLAGCVDATAVDATRPYGLLLRHFHEITRVPALRYRADEIGDIALAILRRLASRRSLRLSLQVIRVLEGYAWPGNVSELEDVLRYVIARKPVGEIQPPDLPTLCFQGRTRKMSMLEAAQCDAIIQALYESRGNRYKAANMLGIARSSLYRKIDAFGISYIA